MQLSSIEVAVQAFDKVVENVDVDVFSGQDASRLVDCLTPAKNRMDALLLAAATRAVSANQHNAEGARSGAAWIGDKTGISEKQARSQLATQKQLAQLPDVDTAVRSGELSLEKASAVTSGADGDPDKARELLDAARSGTVESVNRKAQELNARSSDRTKRERLRKSQFVSARTSPDTLVRAELCLLPEFATGILSAYRNAQGETPFERAESFARLLAESGKRQTQVVFHVDVDLVNGEFEITDRSELEGVGPVPTQSAMDMLEGASLKLVGTSTNKLAWFSEQDRRSTKKPLPEYVKRAVKAWAYGRCEVSPCVRPADDVDHIEARCKKGINDLSNLQAICKPDHNAKTKRDAPWTARVIYGKNRPPPAARSSGDEEKLFPDTG